MFDPRIKLGVAAAGALRPQHLYAKADDDGGDGPNGADGGFNAVTRGVTEWVAEGDRQVSFGWDWVYDPRSHRLQGLWNTLRTNLAIVDEEGSDLGEACVRLCAARLMTHAQWERVLGEALGLPVLLPN